MNQELINPEYNINKNFIELLNNSLKQKNISIPIYSFNCVEYINNKDYFLIVNIEHIKKIRTLKPRYPIKKICDNQLIEKDIYKDYSLFNQIKRMFYNLKKKYSYGLYFKDNVLTIKFFSYDNLITKSFKINISEV